MKYVVTIADKKFDVELNGETVELNGRPISARLIGVPLTPLKGLVLDGSSRTYAMAGGPDGWSVSAGGETHLLRVDDERAVRLARLTGAGDRTGTAGKVTAPMPGLVLRVEVEEGDVVAAGAGLVVLEAMKMENEITAPFGGKVMAVLVSAGQAVDKGTALVELVAEG